MRIRRRTAGLMLGAAAAADGVHHISHICLMPFAWTGYPNRDDVTSSRS
jgi:hypothetical protein